MASGKSCSVENPNGVRRVVNGRNLAIRSKRKTKTTLVDRLDRKSGFSSVVEIKTSLVFEGDY